MNPLHVAPLSVKPTLSGSAGGSPAGEAASSAKTRPAPSAAFADQQKQLAEARASTAQANAERKAQLQSTTDAATSEPPAPVDNFDRKVGFVDGSFEVFVDLVKPPSDEPVARVFGPSENPAPPEAKPQNSASASSAYARAAAALPLKDVGIA